MTISRRDNGKLISIANQLVATKQFKKIEVITEMIEEVLYNENTMAVERNYDNAFLHIEKKYRSGSTFVISGSWIKADGTLKGVHLNVSRRAVQTALGIIVTVDFFDEPAKVAAKKVAVDK